MTMLCGSRASIPITGGEMARVFVTKPFLRLLLASLAWKASVHVVGRWVSPCVLQLVLSHASTGE